MVRVAFLNSAPLPNHIPHILPFALECSYHPNLDCHFYTQDHPDVITAISSLYPNHRCHIHTIKPSKLTKGIRYIRNRPFSHHACVAQCRTALLQANVLVTPDMNLNSILGAIPLNKRPFTILLNHGSGDRHVYIPRKARNIYDICLFPGEKDYQLHQGLDIHIAKTLGIAGYIKFDYTLKAKGFIPTFPEKRPIILYNPHSNKEDGSSWHIWGNAVLDFFYRSNQFNLIFAPHVNLFLRGSKVPPIAERYLNCPHIHIDLNSQACIDMSYTKIADLYLGDRSSQVFEFLFKPRPAVFLNPYQREWQHRPDYYSWRLGGVVNNLDDLGSVIEHQISHQPHAEKQKQAFDYTFSCNEQSAGQRSVQVLLDACA